MYLVIYLFNLFGERFNISLLYCIFIKLADDFIQLVFTSISLLTALFAHNYFILFT